MNDFPWLKTVDSLLLGLWKTFHFRRKNCYILKEIQLVDGMKALNIIKASVTRWLSHGAEMVVVTWIGKKTSSLI